MYGHFIGVNKWHLTVTEGGETIEPPIVPGLEMLALMWTAVFYTFWSVVLVTRLVWFNSRESAVLWIMNII